MAFGNARNGEDDDLAEINMVPLIDVMLVLVVIFIVTAPLLGHAVKVQLPQATSRPADAPPEAIRLSVSADGSLAWNGQPVAEGELDERFADAARADPSTELRLMADRAVPYGDVAKVMAAAARNGLGRIGFATEPVPQAGN